MFHDGPRERMMRRTRKALTTTACCEAHANSHKGHERTHANETRQNDMPETGRFLNTLKRTRKPHSRRMTCPQHCTNLCVILGQTDRPKITPKEFPRHERRALLGKDRVIQAGWLRAKLPTNACKLFIAHRMPQVNTHMNCSPPVSAPCEMLV